MNLHANATTTPKIRTYIQNSTASVAELVAELGVSERTIRRWKRFCRQCSTCPTLSAGQRGGPPYAPRGPLRQFRLADPTVFNCFRCGGAKKSKLITVFKDD